MTHSDKLVVSGSIIPPMIDSLFYLQKLNKLILQSAVITSILNEERLPINMGYNDQSIISAH